MPSNFWESLMASSAADAVTLQAGVWRADTEVTAGIYTHNTHHTYHTKCTCSTHNTITTLHLLHTGKCIEC